MIKFDTIEVLKETTLFGIGIFSDDPKFSITADYGFEEKRFNHENLEVSGLEELVGEEYKEVDVVLGYIKKTYIDTGCFENKFIEVEQLIKEIDLKNKDVKCLELNKIENLILINISENSILKYEMPIDKDGNVMDSLCYINYEENVNDIHYKYVLTDYKLLRIIKEKVLETGHFRIKKLLNQVR